MSTFDWGKPFRQKNGRAARELEELEGGNRRVALKRDDGEWIAIIAKSGGLMESWPYDWSLVNYDPEPAAPPAPAIPDWEQYKEYGGLQVRGSKSPARFYGRVNSRSEPLVFVVQEPDRERVAVRYLDGRLENDGIDDEHDIVLIPPPEPVKHEVEITVYRNSTSGEFVERTSTQLMAHLDLRWQPFARKTVTFPEGEGL